MEVIFSSATDQSLLLSVELLLPIVTTVFKSNSLTLAHIIIDPPEEWVYHGHYIVPWVQYWQFAQLCNVLHGCADPGGR